MIDARLRQFVRTRANGRCEYCTLAQDQEPLALHIEHIVARQHGGKDTAENLALALDYPGLPLQHERTFPFR